MKILVNICLWLGLMASTSIVWGVEHNFLGKVNNKVVVSIEDVKADVDVADSLTKKHSNTLDHAESHSHSGIYEPSNANIQAHVVSSHAPANAQKNSDITKAEIEAVLTGEISSHSHAGGGGPAFPVGSVFISVVVTNPATLLGYGTWISIGAGRVLIGLDSGDIDFDTVEEIGGAKTSTPSDHAGTAVGAHAAHTHAVGTLATDTVTGTRKGGTNGAATLTDSHGHIISGSTGDPAAGLTHSVTQPSNHAAISVVQPYLVVYMWKRTL